MSNYNGRKQDEEVSYWLSYSDMMAGMLLTFVLIIALMMAKSQMSFSDRNAALDAKETELEKMRETIELQSDIVSEQNSALFDKDKLITDQETEIKNKDRLLGQLEAMLADQEGVLEDLVGVRTELIKELKTEFENSDLSIKVDNRTGAITMDSDILFDSGKHELKPEGKEFLDKFMPRYLSIILQPKYKDYVSEIVMEGHTDTVGDYLYNLDLSQQRAFSVANYVLSPDTNVLESSQRDSLQKVLTAIGKSYSELIVDSSGNEDADASRRVEILFRLRDEDMIQEMIHILNDKQAVIQEEVNEEITSNE